MKKIVAVLVVMVIAAVNVMGQNNNGTVITGTVHEGISWDAADFEAQFTKAKQDKDADALFMMALDCVEINKFEEMAKCYKAAAELGKAEAQFGFGMCNQYGVGIKENVQQALTWFKKAAAQGYEANFQLGECYVQAKNYTEALKWYRKGKDNGDERCINGETFALAMQSKDGKKLVHLGENYSQGKSYDRREQAVKCYKAAAELGYAEGQYMLGKCYDEGYGIEKDLQQAIFWFRKAAAQGYAPAQNKLGICYLSGEGVEKNAQEGIKLYTKAAEQGNANAQFNLAVQYYNGEGVEKSYDNAMKWSLKSAEQGHDRAQHLVGILYEYGLGCQKDLTKAAEWYKKSADQGNEDAKKSLEKLNVSSSQNNNSKATTTPTKQSSSTKSNNKQTSTTKQSTATSQNTSAQQKSSNNQTASSQKSSDQQTVQTQKIIVPTTTFNADYTLSDTVPATLNLQGDIVLKNKTPYKLANITVFNDGQEVFAKQNVAPDFDHTVKIAGQEELSSYRGKVFVACIESTGAKEANVDLNLVVTTAGKDLVVKIIAGEETSVSRMWDKTKGGVGKMWNKTKSAVKGKKEE